MGCLLGFVWCWLLLGDVMDVVVVEEDFVFWDYYYFVFGEYVLEDCFGFGVFGIVEVWCDDVVVDD